MLVDLCWIYGWDAVLDFGYGYSGSVSELLAVALECKVVVCSDGAVGG
jgi:hypothetical protein